MIDILYKLTGGRPMLITQYAFTDAFSGMPIYYCKDKFGRKWMAHGAWSMFRVAVRDE